MWHCRWDLNKEKSEGRTCWTEGGAGGGSGVLGSEGACLSNGTKARLDAGNE